MTETFIAINMSPPRIHQLQKITSHWHNQISKCLNVPPDQILLVPLKDNYMLQSTTQPKTYSGADLSNLERNRNFILTPAPNSTDTNILSLIHGSCTITLYSKAEGISTIEGKALLKLNLQIDLKFRLYEFSLQDDLSLRMIRLDHKFEIYTFEEKKITLQRKQEKEDQLKTLEADKNGESISNAVSASILVVMQ